MSYKFILDDARNMYEYIDINTVDLVITSPPYFDIKDYGSEGQIGFGQEYPEYLDSLYKILMGCASFLKEGGKMAVVVGDRFQKSTKDKPFHILPISSDIISFMTKIDGYIVYEGTINWLKVSSSNPSGGGHILGSYPYPPNGIFFTNREYILIFRKVGQREQVSNWTKKVSMLTKEEWRRYFRDSWRVKPAKLNVHPAAFPIEIPRRLIKMYSFKKDLILDPFMGSATTAVACAELGRSFIGFETGFDSPSGISFERILNTVMSTIKLYRVGCGDFQIIKK